MIQDKNIFKKYMNASSAKRVDIIIKNYSDFMGIVDSYTDGLRYMIQSEKEINRRSNMGNLGVRVQSGGMHSDTTAKKAIDNIMTREALIACDFSGNVLDGVDQAEEYMKDAYLLREMRNQFELFNQQLSVLGNDRVIFVKFLMRETTLGDIAEDCGITYESAQQRIHKMKLKVKNQAVGFMDRKLGGIA